MLLHIYSLVQGEFYTAHRSGSDIVFVEADYNVSVFIDRRSEELFGGEAWISPRHLANIELGKNWISIEKLIILATALEENPVDFFEEIIETYQKYK